LNVGGKLLEQEKRRDVYRFLLHVFVILFVVFSGKTARSANRLAVSKLQVPKRSPVKDRWYYMPVIEVETLPVPEEFEDWELYYPPWMRHLHPTMWEHMKKDSTQEMLRHQGTRIAMQKELFAMYRDICQNKRNAEAIR
jgi:hypothetical protein